MAAGDKCCSQETQLTLRSLLGARECVSHITITGHGDDNGGDRSPSLLLMVHRANFKPSITILAAVQGQLCLVHLGEIVLLRGKEVN